MASGDDSDYEVNFHSVEIDKPGGTVQDRNQTLADDVSGQVSKNVTAYMFAAGKEKAKSVLNVYGNIDVLRPYFDVEPHEVRQRLLHSLIPQKPSADVKQKVPRELYGPLMVVFTLIALLLFQMKLASHTVQEGTLMGSAFGVCFGYWIGVSSLAWVLAYVCNTHITVLQLLSLIGYALFGHCVVLFIGTVFHTSNDHALFYLLWAIFGGLSSLKMVSVLVSRTAGQSQKLIICGTLVSLHLLFLFYLHFAYHQTVEHLSEAFDKPVIPQAVNVDAVPSPDVVKRDLGEALKKIANHAPRSPSVAKDSSLVAKHDSVMNNLPDSVKHVARESPQNHDNIINTIAKDAPKVAKDNPVIAKDSPGVAKDSLGVAMDSPGVAKEQPSKLIQALAPDSNDVEIERA